jgi:predicted ABC-class ATPase
MTMTSPDLMRADDRFAMLPWERLRDKLLTLDGKPYAAYKTLEGAYRFERFVLFIDEVPVDPIGTPVPIRIRVDQAEAQVPRALWSTPVRRAALEDFIGRRWHEAARRVGRTRSGRVGIFIEPGGQEILSRTTCRVAEDSVDVRSSAVLPAEGRKASGRQAQALWLEDLGQVVDAALVFPPHVAEATRHVDVAEDYSMLRALLAERGLVAFVADGAVLPRDPDSDRPALAHLVTFQAPPELAVTLETPHRGPITGLGIPRGVTVILGGAFSGRSTLLRAIASAVYPHVPGDGREHCATAPDAVWIRADAGRRVEGVNLTPFISALPGGDDPTRFHSIAAPPLLAEVASIAEALEAGTSLLLFDEDSVAPRLLARDPLWRHLRPDAREAVTPLADLLRPLYAESGVSTIIAGGAGSSLPGIADTVIGMESFRPSVLTGAARDLAAQWPAVRVAEVRGFGGTHHRVPLSDSVAFLRGRRLRADAAGPGSLTLARETLDLRALAHLADAAQARGAGAALALAAERGYVDGTRTIREIISVLEADIASGGLDVLSPRDYPVGDYALPRRQEVAAVLNRLRTLRVKSG